MQPKKITEFQVNGYGSLEWLAGRLERLEAQIPAPIVTYIKLYVAKELKQRSGEK